MSSDVTVIDLAYLAPVPVGNQVHVLEFARGDAGFFDADKAACVIDQTTRIVFGNRAYLDVLSQSQSGILPTDSPAGALGPSWSVTQSLAGQVVGSVMGTTDAMKTNYSRTRLYVRTASAQTYR